MADRSFIANGIYYSKDLKSLRGISFGALNVCSVIRKMDDILTLLGSSELSYLGLTETWLNSSISNCELEIQGHDMCRFDRDLGGMKRGGGGILVYLISNRTFEQLPSWSLCTPDLEWLWTNLKLPDTRPTYICTLYRPPSGNIQNFLDLLELRILDIYTMGISDVLIFGDVNINLKDLRNNNRKKYVNALAVLHLSQLIKDPTRIIDVSSTLVDHILVNRELMYY